MSWNRRLNGLTIAEAGHGATRQSASTICESNSVIFDIKDTKERRVESSTKNYYILFTCMVGDLRLTVDSFPCVIDMHSDILERDFELDIVNCESQVECRVHIIADFCLDVTQSPVVSFLTVQEVDFTF